MTCYLRRLLIRLRTSSKLLFLRHQLRSLPETSPWLFHPRLALNSVHFRYSIQNRRRRRRRRRSQLPPSCSKIKTETHSVRIKEPSRSFVVWLKSRSDEKQSSPVSPHGMGNSPLLSSFPTGREPKSNQDNADEHPSRSLSSGEGWERSVSFIPSSLVSWHRQE